VKKSHYFWSRVWYGKSVWAHVLLPLSAIFWLLSSLRKFFLVNFKQQKLSVPVIVVGNISVGGTGKTPLIIALVKYLQAQGHTPGVVSRGYGGAAAEYPYLLNAASTVAETGDEPLLIYQSTQCLVCVAPDRVAAAQHLIDLGCTHILSDDGLQHYRLGRALEIAVVDGQRLFGNRYLLPAGPLRERITRLQQVDYVLVNDATADIGNTPFKHSFAMNIEPLEWRQIVSGKTIPLRDIHLATPIHAVAGIGNPERFFKTLDALPLTYYAHSFPDHHKFSVADFNDYVSGSVVMTEKDAVKCQLFAKADYYSLVVGARLPNLFWQSFEQKLQVLKG